ncbi:prephenate dehydratase [Candidatus Woesearchaeota archaeon]|nr:prephenate dehydratase [Candidatus Woesearchaeota archaeon]
MTTAAAAKVGRKRKSVGIIGFGRFGQLLARILKDDFEVSASNLSDKSATAEKIGVSYVPVAEAAAKGIVILAVPISEMEAVLKQIKPHLKSGAVIMDTCSVKEYPLRIMQEILPRTVEILGTHPLFGPDSFSDPEAKKIVLCPASSSRGAASAEMRRYLERKGFRTIIASPEEHDRAIAMALNIPQIIGKALNRISFQALLGSKVSTLNSRRLLLIAASVSNDSERLLKDIHAYNRFAHPVEERFGNEVTSVVDELRKHEKANAVIAPAAGPLTATAAIITSAASEMQKMKVAFQGEHGAYSELACRRFFGGSAQTTPCKTLKDVFKAVESGNAAFGIVPVENSLAGDVYESYDLLMDFGLNVYGEAYLRIEHCLIGQPGSRLGNITKVYSHAQALAQCNRFLSEMSAEKIAVYDTAGAVAMIKRSGKSYKAAIASELAAQIYGMSILKKGIESDKDNTTRFFIISKAPSKAAARMKTSLVFSTAHKPGTLYRCMGGFARNSINLTKLVSRPMKNAKWEYVFYLDFEGGVGEKKVQDALGTLKQNAGFVRMLGSYPDGKGSA